MLQTSLLKSLNKTETPIFYPQCVLCLQRQPFRFLFVMCLLQLPSIFSHLNSLLYFNRLILLQGVAGMAKRGNPNLKPRNVASEQCLPCLLWLVQKLTVNMVSYVLVLTTGSVVSFWS